ncbi:MAG: precorrin-6A/cobalt-precorrin-6A reductase [Pseudomonadota bacterium]
MRLLLLAGTPEARQIGSVLSRDARVWAVASIARPSSPLPHPMNLPMRIGGWGSDAAFAEWLLRERISAVLDATHPFASKISHRTAAVCQDLGVDYLQFMRPTWAPGDGDTWVFLNEEADAAHHVDKDAIVYLMTGQRRMEAFLSLNPRQVYVRLPGRPTAAFPFEHGRYDWVVGATSVNAEVERLHGIGASWVIARNSGGVHGMPVLDAARHLGLTVGMIRRPPPPEAPRVQTIAEALAWVRRRL